MINNRSVFCIIPARAGSKGLPNKNKKSLNGKPLIVWSIEHALQSQYIDRIIVSTDCPIIAEIAERAGADVPFLRPKELATDTANTYDVIRHAYNKIAKFYDYILLLEPTSPLRDPGDIDKIICSLNDNSNLFDSIVSVGNMGHHPLISKKIVNNHLTAFFDEGQSVGRRQDLIPAYFPYCVGYLAKSDLLLKENTFYMRRCLAYKIQEHQCYEIDTIYDFVCVEAIMKYVQGY